MQKLSFNYSARMSTLIAKTCEGKEGNDFKQCFKKNAELAGKIYSINDFYSDNYNASRNNDTSLNKSIEILKKIFNPPPKNELG